MKCTYIWEIELRFEGEIQFQVEIPKCGDLQYELDICTFLPLIEVPLTADEIHELTFKIEMHLMCSFNFTNSF